MVKAVVRYQFDTPRTVTITVDLPDDWDEYTDREKKDFYEDEAPRAYAPLQSYEAVEERELRNDE